MLANVDGWDYMSQRTLLLLHMQESSEVVG